MFYDKFAHLCALKGVSVTKATEEIGLARTIATKWKKTGAIPRGETLKKIAAYFDVSESYLLQDENDQQSDSHDIRFALFHGADIEITDDMMREVQNFADYIVQREKNKKDTRID